MRNDIIDKVLLKDLPILYGIREIPELNNLFLFLAYNAGNEASLENISQGSGITKPTITRYIEYLESAFLIMKLSTVNDNFRSLSRERHFKIYLNDPSIRAVLFAPVKSEDTERIGHLTESAIFSNGSIHRVFASFDMQGGAMAKWTSCISLMRRNNHRGWVRLNILTEHERTSIVRQSH